MRKFVLLSLFLCGCVCAFGEVGGTVFSEDYPQFSFVITKEGSSREVSIAAGSSFKASGTLELPSEITTSDGTEYIVTSVADDGFSAKGGFDKLIIPETIEQIGYQAFRNITSQFTLTFKENSRLRVIGDRAFCQSTGLNGDVKIPSTVDTIYSYAFYNCTKSSFTFTSPTPCYLYATAFQSVAGPCMAVHVPHGTGVAYRVSSSAWKTVDPLSVHEIKDPDTGWYYEEYQFEGETGWCLVQHSGKANVPADLVIPREVNGKPVIAVGQNCFNGCNNIESILFPASMRVIENAAFRSITNPFSITLNEGLRVIGDRAFCQSTGLKEEIVIPSTVDTIYGYAFYNDTNIERIIVLATTPPVVVGTNVFDNIYLPIVVPSGTGNIYNETYFWEEQNILDQSDSDIISDSQFLYRIVDKARKRVRLIGFASKMSSPNITIPSSVTTDGGTYTVVAIKKSVFRSNNQLRSVVIPSTVDTIGNRAFQDCHALQSVTIKGCKYIQSYAFYYCDVLTNLVIEDGTQEIGDRSFAWCTALSSVYLPESVTKIEEYAFANYTDLTDLYINSATPPMLGGNNLFWCAAGHPQHTITIHVPCTYATEYQSLIDARTGYWHTYTVDMECGVLELGYQESIKETKWVDCISYRRTFELGKWHLLYLPFDNVSDVLVEDEGELYSINYPYNTTDGGYFYLYKLANDYIDEESNSIGYTLAEELEGKTPYLIQFPEGDGYFAGKDIFFTTKLDEAIKVDATASLPEIKPEGGYRFAGNEGYTLQKVSCGYFFETVDKENNQYRFQYNNGDAWLSPFEFCLVGPASTTTGKPAARMFLLRSWNNTSDDNVSTPISTIHTADKVAYQRHGNTLTIHGHGKEWLLYSMDGVLLYHMTNGSEDVSIDLGAGAYILYCEGNSQKILL